MDKKSIFTVKILLIAPTLGGPCPPDLYIGGGGGGRAPLAPPAPPVPTPMQYIAYLETVSLFNQIYQNTTLSGHSDIIIRICSFMGGALFAVANLPATALYIA